MEKQDDVNDYLMQGIYGTKEMKPEEKIRFLGTFRERVIIALSQKQVRSKIIFPEIEAAIRKYPKTALLLNGETGFEYVSKYIDLANKHKIPYTMVSDRQTDTDIGLVLASPDAVDIESIFIHQEEVKPEADAGSESGQTSFFKKLFHK